MKPDYQRGASEVKDDAVMAALDVTKPTNNAISKKYNVTGFPTLIYFENGVPEIYPGDLLNDDAILKWMLAELKQEEIKELTVPMLNKLIEKGHTMVFCNIG